MDGARSIGLTSAASTPDDLVQEIVAYFTKLNPDIVVTEEGEAEQITFRKPRRVEPTPSV